jgi:hypothetical protein
VKKLLLREPDALADLVQVKINEKNHHLYKDTHDLITLLLEQYLLIDIWTKGNHYRLYK